MITTKEPIKVPEVVIKISKISAIICLLFSVTMIADLIVPRDVVEANVSMEQSNKEVSFGIYSEEVTKSTYEQLENGERVKVEVTKIFHEIRKITLIERDDKVIKFPTVDSYMFIYMILMFLLPSMLFVVSKKIKNHRIIELIFSGISNGFALIVLILAIRLALVHVFNVVDVY